MTDPMTAALDEYYVARHSQDTARLDQARARILAEAHMPESLFASMVRRELDKARAKHAPMNSYHEGYAVILEELDEFWDEVKAWRGSKTVDEGEQRDRILKELVQVGAMAQRAAEDCS